MVTNWSFQCLINFSISLFHIIETYICGKQSHYLITQSLIAKLIHHHEDKYECQRKISTKRYLIKHKILVDVSIYLLQRAISIFLNNIASPHLDEIKGFMKIITIF